MRKLLSAALGLVFITSAAPALADNFCPAGGTIRFGVEPYEATAKLLPIYNAIGDLIAKQVGCPVQVDITTSYNAEIEAMRSNKLEIGEFGPLGYVLAHQVADAQAIATFADKNGDPSTYTASIVTWPGSGITTLQQVAGHTFAYADPASTSGHLFPAYGLKSAGIDPDHGVTALFAGSHTASFEAIRNHKVEAGEMNSEQIELATQENQYNAKDYVTLWQSKPIPVDPIAINPRLNPALEAKLTTVLQNLDLSELSAADQKIISSGDGRLVPQTDAAYDQIRSLVHVLNIDLTKIK